MRQWRLVVLLGCELGILIAFASMGDLRRHVPQFILLFMAAAVLYLAAALTARQLRLSFAAIFVVALQLRIPMFLTEPTLSDDVWRYIHDGRAQLAGVNPYLYPPADAATAQYRGPEYPRINHPHLPTIYPPVAQYAFRIAASFNDPLFAWRLLLLAAEMITLVAAALLLKQRGLPAANLALYAWHPLAIVEGIGNAHLEPLGIAFLVLTAYWLSSGTHVRTGIALALAVATKLVAAPLVLLTARKAKVAAVFAVTVLAVYAPFVGNDVNVFGSLQTFGETWASNGSIYSLLMHTLSGREYRLLASAIALIVLLIMALRRVDFIDAATVFFLVFFLLSPVVHPWYLLWVLALLPLRARPFDPAGAAALVWSVSVVLAYYAQLQLLVYGVWQIPSRLLLAEYVPVYLPLMMAATALAFSQMKLMAITRKNAAKI